MPCSSSDGMGNVSQSDIYQLKRELDRVTAILCKVIRSLDGSTLTRLAQDQDMKKWWEEHRHFDREQGRP